ncbi:unnamed protein product, partial [Ectocarpus sp. 12 AP-2014]
MRAREDADGGWGQQKQEKQKKQPVEANGWGDPPAPTAGRDGSGWTAAATSVAASNGSAGRARGGRPAAAAT